MKAYLENGEEFTKEFCNKCINRKGFDDVCEIRRNIKGELQCVNFEEERKENNNGTRN